MAGRGSPGDPPATRLADRDRTAWLRQTSRDWPSWAMDAGQMDTLELLITGAFAPLNGYMGPDDLAGVTEHMRLADGTLWPVPVLLEVSDELARIAEPGMTVALRDSEGVMIAALRVGHRWRQADTWLLSGPVEGLQPPLHYDFTELRLDPAGARRAFAERGWQHIVAHHPGEPILGEERDALRQAAAAAGAGLFVHAPVVTPDPGDHRHYRRVRALRAATEQRDEAMLALLPLRLPEPGPRATLLRALVAANFGCTHLVVADDEPHELLDRHDEVAITPVVMPMTAHRAAVAEMRRRLAEDLEVPPALSPPAVTAELGHLYPPPSKQGFTVLFTGLSGSGKSTIANILTTRLLEIGQRRVTLLDGDLVRRNLSSELGFSREHRDLNVRRIGFVAAQVARHGGVAVCAPIAPYDATRKAVREMVEEVGGFVLVHVATPVEVCEARDRKGLYAKARAGLISEFTGISDPYEHPDDADVVVDTTTLSALEATDLVLEHLRSAGYLR